MHFDLETLYELHYQMITLGKVGYFLMVSFAIANTCLCTAKASQRNIIFRNHHCITSDFMTGYPAIKQVLAMTVREGQATRYLQSVFEKVTINVGATP